MLPGHVVRAMNVGTILHGWTLAHPDRFEGAQLGVRGKTVAALDLGARGAAQQHFVEPSDDRLAQVVTAGAPGGIDGLDDAAAGGGDSL